MNDQRLDATLEAFLKGLYDKIGADISRSASMYDIGAEMGLDRAAASQVAQDLMEMGILEIRTLAGGVGFSEPGIEKVRPKSAAAKENLGKGPFLDDAGRKVVEKTQLMVKQEVETLGLSFPALEELLADLRTIDAQLTHPRPKTAVIRECYKAVAALLATASSSRSRVRIKELLSE